MLTHPESKLADSWEYYVRGTDRIPGSSKSITEITFLDPAVGSGHFLLEAFDLFYSMYEEDGACGTPKDICACILNRNLFGIDIDERAVQITQAVLWMKAKEKASDLDTEDLNEFSNHIIATNIRLPKGKDHLEAFLKNHPEDKALTHSLETVFEALENVHELGTLAKIEEPVGQELQKLKAAYEKSKKEKKQDEFFPEFEKPVQGELPVGVETYDAWKGRTVSRLKDHFLKEAETAELSRAFFSRSATKGLMLFDLLSRKYDVVAANPPYMGSKNMGTILKKYVEHHYKPGKRDLYASFILRCLELAKERGRVAMVTQQSWMFLRSFAELRAVPEEKLTDLPKDVFRGLLRDATVETVVHLGPGAFSEISGEVVNSVMFTLAKLLPTSERQVTAIKLVGCSFNEKKLLLIRAISKRSSVDIHNVYQTALLNIPESPILYWLTPSLLKLFTQEKRLEKIAEVKQGMATADNERFLRCCWEVKSVDMRVNSGRNSRWVQYAKGGGYCKWFGNNWLVVDWGEAGERIKAFPSSVIRNPSYYFRPGLTYTQMARGSMGTRISEASVFDVKGMSIFTLPSSSIHIYCLCGFLSSHVVSWLLRTLTQNMEFHAGYVIFPRKSGHNEELVLG